jgi:hypothetical protein
MATNHKLARVRDRLVGSHCDGKWIKRDSASIFEPGAVMDIIVGLL